MLRFKAENFCHGDCNVHRRWFPGSEIMEENTSAIAHHFCTPLPAKHGPFQLQLKSVHDLVQPPLPRDVLEMGGIRLFKSWTLVRLRGSGGLAGESSSIYSCIQIYKKWGGVWDPKMGVPTMAPPDLPNAKLRCFPRWSLWVWGGGGQGGVPPHPPTVYSHSNTSLTLPLLPHTFEGHVRIVGPGLRRQHAVDAARGPGPEIRGGPAVVPHQRRPQRLCKRHDADGPVLLEGTPPPRRAGGTPVWLLEREEGGGNGPSTG